MDKRFTGGKHFWSAVAVDRPKTKKKFNENIELYKPEGDFSDEEKIEHITALTGAYPLNLVLTDDIRNKLEQKQIPPIGQAVDTELPDGTISHGHESEFVWFIPRSKEVKKTKNGKPYWIIGVTDSTNTLTEVKFWGIKESDVIHMNRPYLAQVNRDGFGISIRSLKQQLRLLA